MYGSKRRSPTNISHLNIQQNHIMADSKCIMDCLGARCFIPWRLWEYGASILQLTNSSFGFLVLIFIAKVTAWRTVWVSSVSLGALATASRKISFHLIYLCRFIREDAQGSLNFRVVTFNAVCLDYG